MTNEQFKRRASQMPTNIDWRRVLLAYIEVVGEAEGVDFISDENTSEHLTPVENKALYDIAVKTRYGYRD